MYASNRFFADGSYPARYLYAPPLLPALIELAMLAAGPTSYAAVLPNLIFSTLTVALCWWAAREWFGRSAGFAAAALAAFNDFYSRTAAPRSPIRPSASGSCWPSISRGGR